MEHVKSDKDFLREVYRVLKTGGYNILFNLPNKFSLTEVLVKMMTISFRLDKWKLFLHDRRYTKRNIFKLFTGCGFKRLKVRTENLVPAQVNIISKKWGKIFDKYHKSLDKLDYYLNKSPLRLFSQSFIIVCRK